MSDHAPSGLVFLASRTLDGLADALDEAEARAIDVAGLRLLARTLRWDSSDLAVEAGDADSEAKQMQTRVADVVKRVVAPKADKESES